MDVVFCKIDHCIHILWHIFMGLGLNDPWVELHLWPQLKWGQRSSWGHWPLVKILQNSHCIRILCCITMGVGHNDPWVESHMRHHMLGQRSSEGRLRLLTFWRKFLKNSHLWDLTMNTYHLNSYGVKSNIQWLQFLVCDHETRRDLWFENRLVDCNSMCPGPCALLHM